MHPLWLYATFHNILTPKCGKSSSVPRSFILSFCQNKSTYISAKIALFWVSFLQSFLMLFQVKCTSFLYNMTWMQKVVKTMTFTFFFKFFVWLVCVRKIGFAESALVWNSQNLHLLEKENKNKPTLVNILIVGC